MKKILLLLVTLFMVSGIALSQEWRSITVSWNDSVADGDSLLTTSSDTSAVFDLVMTEIKPFSNTLATYYPETLTFTSTAVQLNSGNDTEAYFRLEMSNDAAFTYPVAVTAIDSLQEADVDEITEAQIITNMPLLRYGRIIVTCNLDSGDTISVSNGLTADYSNY